MTQSSDVDESSIISSLEAMSISDSIATTSQRIRKEFRQKSIGAAPFGKVNRKSKSPRKVMCTVSFRFSINYDYDQNEFSVCCRLC